MLSLDGCGVARGEGARDEEVKMWRHRVARLEEALEKERKKVRRAGEEE
jgi:hypothetical protein